ncbi:DNA-binding response regulator, NarL/FixJ family, contains REC and HTH domains [Pustulibacterium marinum]|uniref:DNA-binding response regulator, NarL/FixJ family, contains REC and HTH domains n=1 Tax=Pustulibacterium marinum TaxID=1224947 RepID=A0A1I7ESV8_9FLAO|nr:response regulator transcription factor [Pustulibacterium marinum]SFU27008.1 DNA-binding response regulator, NarL/FixJ family, contains REC and HTH domains [Pustulibacterium marinum]
MEQEKIKIAIADDEALFRAGILFILNRVPEFDVLFDAENGVDLLEILEDTQEKPNIILMDIKMPEMNGVECTKIIQEDYPDIHIIALSSYGGKTFINNMIAVGASSYLLKNTSPKKVVETIKEVHKVGFCYDEWVHKVLDEEIKPKNVQESDNLFDNDLSRRELEILELICEQYTNQEIAERLFISARTVEGHRKSLLKKTSSKNVAGLVVYGIVHNLVHVTPNF